ncbi:30S ribosomal protein S4e [Candidatus Woesearchaeota archaeon]|nr:30S ribosomal protein S4e [Candidatus Woesearchaeota archaeon]
MVQNHMSRLAAPKCWQILKKENKWVIRSSCGPHPLYQSIPITLLLREYLGYAKNYKEVKSMLQDKEVLINNKVIHDTGYPVGLMDILDIPKLKETYVVFFNKKEKIVLKKIESTNIHLLKIKRKNTVKKGKVQITFHNGMNLLFDKSKEKIGDSVLFNFREKKIEDILPLKKNSLIYFCGGSNVGRFGKVKEIIEYKNKTKEISCDIEGKEYISLLENLFVINDHIKNIMEQDGK